MVSPALPRAFRQAGGQPPPGGAGGSPERLAATSSVRGVIRDIFGWARKGNGAGLNGSPGPSKGEELHGLERRRNRVLGPNLRLTIEERLRDGAGQILRQPPE